MDERDWLAKSFEEKRTHLRAVAYRMLGSMGEAEDAVQEAWLRLNRSDASAIENPGGWLTTVVARVCLDMLRARKSRREESLGEDPPVPRSTSVPPSNPETELLVAESVGPALLVLLETLAPAERVAFVLHDLFDLPFDEVASIVGRSEAATRQLASRARRRVRGVGETAGADGNRQREIVAAFLSAARDGDFAALVGLLGPDVVLHADDTAVRVATRNEARGAPPFRSEIRGARAVAETFRGRAGAVRLALVDGSIGATWAPGGEPLSVFAFAVRDGRIVGIDVFMDRERIGALDVELVGD
jgi:RNA polymerase sigma-70 factor (ECF subfamily)